MATYYGCDIPEDLYYHPEYDSWVRFEEDNCATLGMTDIAQTAAGKVLHIRFKAAGKRVKAGRSAVTIESAKWVGPFRMPFAAEIMATNEPAFTRDILIANKDPYGEGWLLKVRILQPETVRDHLLTGAEAITFLQKRIDDNEIRCFRCLDDPVPMGSGK
ncbi:MAG: glycine cleavage system protein H [Anaerolineae bacterium]